LRRYSHGTGSQSHGCHFSVVISQLLPSFAPTRRVSRNTRPAPFAPASVRVVFVHRILPRDNLIFVPNFSVRRDVGPFRKRACLLHSEKRGAREGYDREHFFSSSILRGPAEGRSAPSGANGSAAVRGGNGSLGPLLFLMIILFSFSRTQLETSDDIGLLGGPPDGLPRPGSFGIARSVSPPPRASRPF
jgi:hypothetical protein